MAATLVLLSMGVIAYAWIGYPLIAFVRARLWPHPVERAPIRPPVAVVIAAWREVSTIEAKLADLAHQSYPPELVRVVVACDGSDDGTPRAARHAERHLVGRLTVVELPSHRGKAAALDAGVAAAAPDAEIIVFTDARQSLSPNAIEALVENLADEEVGAVGGELVLAGEEAAGFYWKYEAAIRRWEARAGSTVGVSGALYAVRRALLQPLPEETLLDDLLVPMRVRMAGRRVALEPAAQAFDEGVSSSREFQRKVRTLSGNFQLLLLEPSLLLPWRNPSWFELVSHKLVRLLAPWAMVVTFIASTQMTGLFGLLLVAGQIAAYSLALSRWLSRGPGSRLARLCEAVVVLNAAALVGTLRFLRRGRHLSWR
jgi:cellulose synthase/poly-beta-1,6-N-acetylglucosamine synthase-like glycosyltransferase